MNIEIEAWYFIVVIVVFAYFYKIWVENGRLVEENDRQGRIIDKYCKKQNKEEEDNRDYSPVELN